jgi:hypothetical protein
MENTLDDKSISPSRGEVKHQHMKKEKWKRQIKKTYHNPDPSEQNYDFDPSDFMRKEDNLLVRPIPTGRSRKTNNHIANPRKIPITRSRTESPPPKNKRGNKGANKGHAKACSFCRPQIHKRMEKEASVKRYVRTLDHTECDDLADSWD